MVGIDGIIRKGNAYLDTSSLTGELVFKKVSINDKVLSGCIVDDGVLTIEATTIFQESTANKILSLIEKATENKAPTEKFITKFSKIYTPTITMLSVLNTIISILLGKDFNSSIYASLVFLVMSCPCALVLATPLAYFCGIGRASREGILIKGANELESISKIDSIMFDKTGTITKDVFEVINVNATNCNKDEFIKLVAHAEYYSTHPIGKSIQKNIMEQ